MTNYRLLLSFITVSWIFLSGFNQAVDDTSTEASQKTKQATIKAKEDVVADEHNPVNYNELEKPLDLSVPFNNTENADLKIEQKSATQNRVNNIFAPETKKKPRPLELDGDFLMSPEPEAEKRKSVDGAGIVIKLKP